MDAVVMAAVLIVLGFLLLLIEAFLIPGFGFAGVLGGVFPRVHLYNYSNLVYPGGLWSFTYASVGDRCPIAGLRTGSVEALEPGLSYYGEAVHRAAFVHPAFQARALRGLVTPLTAGRSAG